MTCPWCNEHIPLIRMSEERKGRVVNMESADHQCSDGGGFVHHVAWERGW